MAREISLAHLEGFEITLDRRTGTVFEEYTVWENWSKDEILLSPLPLRMSRKEMQVDIAVLLEAQANNTCSSTGGTSKIRV